MTPNVTNVLNIKSLEKQLKLYDARIQVLQEEMDELQRLRSACHLLLGQSPQENVETPESKAASASKRAKNRLSTRIFDLLRERHEGMTADAIHQELRSAGVPLAEEDADAEIETTLKKHPELFSLAEDNRWIGNASQNAPSSEQAN